MSVIWSDYFRTINKEMNNYKGPKEPARSSIDRGYSVHTNTHTLTHTIIHKFACYTFTNMLTCSHTQTHIPIYTLTLKHTHTCVKLTHVYVLTYILTHANMHSSHAHAFTQTIT